MKCFLKGFFGAFAAMAIAAVAIPQYSDYRAYAETQRWLVEIEPLRLRIEERGLRAGTLKDVSVGLTKPDFRSGTPAAFRIDPDGTILIKGRDEGQVVLLTPTLRSGSITWACVGGPDDAIPKKCR